ncbi:MAG: GntR family transcriptional regulator [Burkholderiaceae bacterium]|nr:GntR family transcriptional regulator [Burkholderiaceae bacterium]
MQRLTLSENAYQSIREMILGGQVAPGEKLPLERLAGQLSMGTTPLREALSRLAVEGLVIGHGQRGYWAASVSLDEFQQITDLRLDLEPKAFGLSVQKGDFEWEGRVVAAFHQLSRVTARLAVDPQAAAPDWERKNKEFHMTLIECCGNAWLLRFTGMLFEQSERYRHLSVSAQAVPPQKTHDEHEALMRAALDRDHLAAVKILSEHIRASASAAISKVFPEGANAFASPAGPTY